MLGRFFAGAPEERPALRNWESGMLGFLDPVSGENFKTWWRMDNPTRAVPGRVWDGSRGEALHSPDEGLSGNQEGTRRKARAGAGQSRLVPPLPPFSSQYGISFPLPARRSLFRQGSILPPTAWKPPKTLQFPLGKEHFARKEVIP